MINYYENKTRRKLLDRLSKIYKFSPGSLEQLLTIEFKTCFRINALKAPIEKTMQDLRSEGFDFKPIEWCSGAYILISKSKFELSESKYFKEGYIYIQNASSLIPALIMNVREGDFVLDMCAAPGGKAIQVAGLGKNKIKLWVNDSMKHRYETLLQLLPKYNVNVFNATMYKGEEIGSKIDIQFDKILIDAQCSGEGMINFKNHHAMRYWSLERIYRFHGLQKKFLENGYKLLKPGGILVYTTCTFAPEENENSIDYILRKHDDLSVEKIELRLDNFVNGIDSWDGKGFKQEIKNSIRILPNEIMEGFFVCKLKKQK